MALYCESEYDRGAGCGKTARPDLHGGYGASCIPTITNIKHMKKKIIIVIVTLTLSGLIFHFSAGETIVSEYLTREQKENLEFSFGLCRDEFAYKNEITSSYWSKGGTLSVKGTATPNCGTTWIFGDYELTGEDLTLSYSPIMGSLVGCVCGYPVEYEIEGLEKREYNISLIELGGVYKQPMLLKMIFESL